MIKKTIGELWKRITSHAGACGGAVSRGRPGVSCERFPKTSPMEDFKGVPRGVFVMFAETVRTVHFADFGAQTGESGLSSAWETVWRQQRRSTYRVSAVGSG